MTWAEIVPLIIRYGIPGAHEIVRIISESPTPTPEAWEKLLAVNRKTLDQYVTEAATRLGITPPPPPT